MNNRKPGFWENTKAEFKKSSLKERIAAGVAVTGLAVLIANMSTVYNFSSRTYPLVQEENAITYELKSLKHKKFLVESKEVSEKYSAYETEYTKNLESKLQEIQSAPQYVAEKQNSEEDKKSRENSMILFFLSWAVAWGASWYGSREVRKRQNREKYQTISGASK